MIPSLLVHLSLGKMDKALAWVILTELVGEWPRLCLVKWCSVVGSNPGSGHFILFFNLQLATRCQDLIPRAILCLTKVAKQHINNPDDEGAADVLVSRAQELINLLKLPKWVGLNISKMQCFRLFQFSFQTIKPI